MEKQMKKSLSRQMTAVFVGLLAFVLAAVFIVNAVFLGHYYTTHKESDLLNTYNALKEAQESDELTDENKQWKLSYELEKMNIDVCVMNVDRDAGTINEIFSNVKEKSLLYDQTLRIFFSKDTGNETVLKSTDQYVMRKMTDRQNGTDYLEMWGYLDDDFFVLMRSPLESIRESASLANQFLIYLGIIGMVVGGLLVWIFSRKITRPVMELARLSEDMANLNFDMKYTSGGNNEIGILGENFNKMSLQLEKTVSELKTANNQLQKDIEQKEKLEDMRNEFLGNVSHELKTPLTLILLAAEKLTDANQPGKECRTILYNVKRMLALISELVDIRKQDLGLSTLHLDWINMSQMIRQLFDDMSSWAENKHITITYNADDNDIEMDADKEKIGKMILNLFSNAIKYTDEGGRIDISFKQGTQKDVSPCYDTVHTEGAVPADVPLCILTVKDTGIGISSESIHLIYERFFQVNGNSQSHLGSGIGLAIVKSVVLQHKGMIVVSSERMRGSEFIIALPVYENCRSNESSVGNQLLDVRSFIDEQYNEFEPVKTSSVGGDEPVIDNPDLPTLLIVEDNQELQSALKERLSAFYNIHIADNGRMGLEKCMSVFPDIIVSDVMMPLMSGMEMCMKIKNNIDLCHILPAFFFLIRKCEKAETGGARIGIKNERLFSPPTAKKALTYRPGQFFCKQHTHDQPPGVTVRMRNQVAKALCRTTTFFSSAVVRQVLWSCW